MNTYDFSRLPHIVHPGLLPLFPDARAAVCQWFEDFARRLAPADLSGAPLYVVDADLTGPGDTLGFAGESLDLAYQEKIGPRWRGRGACFAIDLQQVQDNAARQQGNEEMQRDEFIRQALGLGLHEVAHVLTGRRLFNPDISPSDAQQVVVRCLQTPADDMPGCRVPWAGHDAQFLRTVAHVEHRAQTLLRSPVQAYAVAGLAYGLSPADAYRHALADEPARLADEPFTAIKQARPPQAFVDLWRADLKLWHGRIGTPSVSQALAMEQGQTLFL